MKITHKQNTHMIIFHIYRIALYDFNTMILFKLKNYTVIIAVVFIVKSGYCRHIIC